jgi:rSAM/selenodomain-associated transferase 2/rSAM/selenodomain-associated transferase 1
MVAINPNATAGKKVMSASFRNRLIIFTRYPEPGTTKTRMIPELGAEGAADLQRRMTEHLMASLRALITRQFLAVEIRFEGGSERLMQNWLGPSFAYVRQGEGDIGERMQRALTDGFESGSSAVVIIGSDIPDISSAVIERAFEALEHNKLVLGPAGDGGYYLFGLQKAEENPAYPELFKDINWGSTRVLSQTIDAADQLGIGYTLLDSLDDVDLPEDLKVWNRTLRSGSDPKVQPRLSVIIPTLNEAGEIERSLSTISKSDTVEIVVVDGGSSDGTVEKARKFDARVLLTVPSKAGQMNAGAAEARGEVLLFLHADTCLPRQFEQKVLATVNRKGVSAGAFTLGIDSRDPGLRLIERVANWRARLFQLPYGDQGLFVPRQLFSEIGGFPDYPIMEDFELVRRLKKFGKIAILPDSVITSPRRWQNIGAFRSWLINQIILAGYFIGIPPQRLAGWYRRESGRTGKEKV